MKNRIINIITLCISIILIFMNTKQCDKAILNNDPLLEVIIPSDTVQPGSVNLFKAIVSDPDTDKVELTWQTTHGNLNRTTGVEIIWTAPTEFADVIITVSAEDENKGSTTEELIIYVRNENPKIIEFKSSSNIVLIGNYVELTCIGDDTEDSELIYNFYSMNGAGEFIEEDGADNTIQWHAPHDQSDVGSYTLIVDVSDKIGYSISDTLEVMVYSDYASVWIVDSENKTVEKYGSNGDKILTAEEQFSRPIAITNNTNEFYGCWVADYDLQTIFKINPIGKTVEKIEEIGRIIAIDIHKDTKQLCALEIENSTIKIIDTYSNTVTKTVHGFNSPNTLKINQITGDVWVCEPNRNRVVRFNINTPPDTINQNSNCDIFTDNLNNPIDIEIGHKTPTIVYIVDKNDNAIERIDNSTLLRLPSVTGFYLPEKISISSEQKVWIIDDIGGIYYFDEDNINDVQPINLFATTTFYDPHVMDVDPDGNIWIGDNGSKTLVRITPAGKETQIPGFNFIENIIINQ